MEKPKNLYVWPMDMNLERGNAGGSGFAGWRGIKGIKKWDNCNSIINKIYLKKGSNPYSVLEVREGKSALRGIVGALGRGTLGVTSAPGMICQ